MPIIRDPTHIYFLEKIGVPLWVRYKDRKNYNDGWDPKRYATSSWEIEQFDFSTTEINEDV